MNRPQHWRKSSFGVSALYMFLLNTTLSTSQIAVQPADRYCFPHRILCYLNIAYFLLWLITSYDLPLKLFTVSNDACLRSGFAALIPGTAQFWWQSRRAGPSPPPMPCLLPTTWMPKGRAGKVSGHPWLCQAHLATLPWLARAAAFDLCPICVFS